jgi:hypothetical protein
MYVKERIFDRKLIGMEPGLVKLIFPNEDNLEEELALKLTPSLANCVSLPNDVLCYRNFLREGMKAIWSGGLKPIGPFSSFLIQGKYIEEIKNRTIKLNLGFCDFNKNYDDLAIAGNSPYIKDAISEMKRTLLDAGFNVDSSKWDDYKIWEIEKLKSFN